MKKQAVTTFRKSRHITRQEKVINAAVEISDKSPSEANAIGFGAKCVISGCLPYNNPTQQSLKNGCWIRTNGEYSLIVQGGENGIPYGTFPRIFTIWATGEAIKTGSRDIYAGNSIRDFLKKVGVDTSRGKRGSGKALIDQTTRFLDCRVFFKRLSESSLDTKNIQVAEDYSLFWESRDPDQTALFDSYIKLTQRFFEEITTHCIPLDMRAIAALKSSPMALDIYQWLAYRLHYIHPGKPSFPKWKDLKLQFGSEYGRQDHFRNQFIKKLNQAMVVYPEAKVEVTKEGVILRNSPPPVSKKLVLVKS